MACAGLGIQTWIGGEVIYFLAGSSSASWANASRSAATPGPCGCRSRSSGCCRSRSSTGAWRRIPSLQTGGALRAPGRRCDAVVDEQQGLRLRPAARPALQARMGGDFWVAFWPRSYGHDRLLVHAVAEHSRLHPVRQEPEGADWVRRLVCRRRLRSSPSCPSWSPRARRPCTARPSVPVERPPRRTTSSASSTRWSPCWSRPCP